MFKAISRVAPLIAALALLTCFFDLVPASAQVGPTSGGTISGSLSDAGGKPVVGAQIKIEGASHRVTQTDAHGLFVIVGIPLGDYTLSAISPTLGTITRTLSVQGDINVAIAYEPTTVNGLKTIASVSANANAQFNVTPASITQVNPMANAFEGKTSWRTILEQIPGVAQAGLSNGSNAQAAFPDGPLVPMQISIDGGLTYETSILLDDMPMIGGSLDTLGGGGGTDLSDYPINAFGTADVVRGPGAAAPSIVDSIGGSFILHAPGAVTKDSYEMSASTDPYGGIVLNGLAQVRWGRLSIVATYGLNDSPGPLNAQGFAMGATSFIQTIDGHAFTPYASPTCNPPGCQFGSYLVDPRFTGSSGALSSYYGENTGLYVCCVDQSSAWSQHNASYALSYALPHGATAELFYVGQSTLTVRPASDFTDIFTPPAGYTGSLPVGQQVDSDVNPCLTFDGQSENSNLLEEKLTIPIGAGTLRLAAIQNRTSYYESFTTPSSATLQLFGGGTLDGTTPVVYNGSFHQVALQSIGETFAGQVYNRDLSFEYQTPIGENAHAGVSFVQSYYNNPTLSLFDYGPPLDFGSVSLTPSGVSETTREMRLVVGGNPSSKTSLDLSTYLVGSNYHVPTAGSSTVVGAPISYENVDFTYATPRLGFTWRPTASVALRASAGGGFAQSALSDFVGCPASFSGLFYEEKIPNVNIQPEKSFAFDVGADIRLSHNTQVSFDVYRADLTGQLYETTSLVDSNFNGTGLPLYAQQYENLGNSRYEGVLIDVHHDVPRGVYWTFSGGLTRGYIVSVPKNFYDLPGETCNFTTTAGCTNLNVVPGINFNGTMVVGPGGEGGASIPYSQALGSLGYRWNPAKFVGLTATYYGNNNTYFRPAFVELDGNVGYPLTKNVSLLVTFRNITGIYDSSIQLYQPSNFMGVPALAGLPWAEYGEEYGPRTIIVTTNVRF